MKPEYETELEEIVELLGPPRRFVICNELIQPLRRWAELKGMPPAAAAIAKVSSLVNYYHAGEIPESVLTPPAPKVTEQDLLTAFLNGVRAAGLPEFPADVMRRLINEEFGSPAVGASLQQIAVRAAQATYAQLPPKVIHVMSPTGVGIIDGLFHAATETVVRVAALGHPTMLVGPAGSGKTSIAEHAAKALSLPFYITNAINDTHELIGFNDGFGKYHPTPFRYAFEFGGIWVADEIDAWDASALLAANSALANGFAAFPDVPQPVKRHPNFRMIATANTFGTGPDRLYVGRNELDAASLDRFAVLEIDYDRRLETHFAGARTDWLRYVWTVREKVQELRIRHVVSSRAIIMGSAALESGLPWDMVKETYLFKGMSEGDRKKIAKAS